MLLTRCASRGFQRASIGCRHEILFSEPNGAWQRLHRWPILELKAVHASIAPPERVERSPKWPAFAYLKKIEAGQTITKAVHKPANVVMILRDIRMALLSSGSGNLMDGGLINHDGSAYDSAIKPVRYAPIWIGFEYSTEGPHHFVYTESKDESNAHMLLVPQQLSKFQELPINHNTITAWPNKGFNRWAQFWNPSLADLDSSLAKASHGDTDKINVLLVMYGAKSIIDHQSNRPATAHDDRIGRAIVELHHERLLQLSESLGNCHVEIAILCHASEAHTAASVGLEWNRRGDSRVRVAQVIAAEKCLNFASHRTNQISDGLFVDLKWQGYTVKPQQAVDEYIWRRFWLGGLGGTTLGLAWHVPDPVCSFLALNVILGSSLAFTLSDNYTLLWHKLWKGARPFMK
jgi:hypothetical protein